MSSTNFNGLQRDTSIPSYDYFYHKPKRGDISSITENFTLEQHCEAYASACNPPLPTVQEPQVIQAVRDLLPNRDWFRSHRFFQLAKEHPEALILWVTQECRVSTPFTRYAAEVAGRFRHRDLRNMAFVVAEGELGANHDEFAAWLKEVEHDPRTAEEKEAFVPKPLITMPKALDAHAVLLNRMRIEMGISDTQVVSCEETRKFLAVMTQYCDGPALGALAALGEGNEHYLLYEYAVVREAFDEIAPRVWPHLDYRSFIKANIGEDTEHARILRYIASILIRGTTNKRDFIAACDMYYEAARTTILERNAYYDALAESVEVFIQNGNYLDELSSSRPLDAVEYQQWMNSPHRNIQVVNTILSARCNEKSALVRAGELPRYGMPTH